MKSLEILEHVKNAPEFMGGDERYKNNIQSHWVFLEDIETIKRYLEVLEILRKYLFIEKYVDSWFEIDLYEGQQKEDFNKVKQWLEEEQ